MRDLDEHQQSALDLLTSRRVRDAFDISQEPDAVRDQRGDTQIELQSAGQARSSGTK